ncbi:MAG: XRE family transcriptional regulator [Alphaproteobacteria bacterium PRO2]|nr:XRE family transcriptional regulator [Alphaproteobacteria bacterium PRO2]
MQFFVALFRMIWLIFRMMRKIKQKTNRNRRRLPLKRRVSIQDVELGKRLRIARLLANLSQKQTASSIGVTFQQIQKYEKGLNRISAARLAECCNLYGKPYAFFLDDLGSQVSSLENTSSSWHGIYDHIEKYKKLIQIFEKIPDEECRNIIISLTEHIIELSRERNFG